MLTNSDILCDPSAEYPGWNVWELRDPSRFNVSIMGRTIIRAEDDGKARIRMFPERRHSNMFDGVHGGMIMALIDVALFPTLYLLSPDHDKAAAFNALTLETSVQFIGAARFGQPLDAVGEIMRQTGRLAFIRGVVEQDGNLVASWSGLVRKPSAR